MIALLTLFLFAPAPVDSTEAAAMLVQQAVTNYTAPHDPTPEAGLWRIAWGDVNDDGLQDALVFSSDLDWCSPDGCTLLVVEAVPEYDQEELGDYFVAAEIEMVNAPVRLSPERSVGWADLIVSASDGGSVRLRFDGETYPFSAADGIECGDDPGTVLFAVAE